MPIFTVDTDAVFAATGATRATMERLQSESTALMAHLSQLQSSWTGSAAAAFQSCSEQWRTTQAQVEQTLAAISAALGSAASQYSDADQYSTSLFR